MLLQLRGEPEMLAYLIFAVVVMAFFSALTWLMSLGGSPAGLSV